MTCVTFKRFYDEYASSACANDKSAEQLLDVNKI